MTKDYPYNLLDEIASGPNNKNDEWDCPFHSDTGQTLAYILAGLSEREREVIAMRYEKNLKLSEIGEALGVSHERVRQIECRAIRKLRHPTNRNLLTTGVRKAIDDAYTQGRLDGTNERLERATANIELIVSALRGDPRKAAAAITGEADIKAVSIVDAGLSTRTYNALNRAGIKTLDEAARMGTLGLAKIRNLGDACMAELLEKLKEFGLEPTN